MDIKKNEGQEAVINTTEGQLIVIACPGSGKTTTLVRRIHHMVADCNIPSESILMVTFSNAAAKEIFISALTNRAETNLSTLVHT